MTLERTLMTKIIMSMMNKIDFTRLAFLFPRNFGMQILLLLNRPVFRVSHRKNLGYRPAGWNAG